MVKAVENRAEVVGLFKRKNLGSDARISWAELNGSRGNGTHHGRWCANAILCRLAIDTIALAESKQIAFDLASERSEEDAHRCRRTRLTLFCRTIAREIGWFAAIVPKVDNVPCLSAMR